MNQEETYKELIYVRTYSRWDWKKERRETWEETIERYFSYMEKQVPEEFRSEFRAIQDSMYNMDVMPSMRALWTAGESLDKCNVGAYNCAYTTIDRVKVFSEILYVLLQGAGCGFSVERQYIAKLPAVAETLNESDDCIVFPDSKKGWAEGYNSFISGLYEGKIHDYDLSKIRPAGSILKTFGGRASGPEPMEDLLKFTLHTFKEAQGRKLTSLECHDIVCYIADTVVSGGVRRSATISLSNLSDQRMQKAKDGNFWESHPQRSLANNSVAYTEIPDMNIFMEEWTRLMSSGTGERGIFNRESAENIVKSGGRRKLNPDFGCNPCSEIILRPNEFCNLSEVVVRPNDKLGDLLEKVKNATILGAIQSTLTNFDYLSDEWKINCDEERLLGVSLTGIMDHPVLSNLKKKYKMEEWLSTMKDEAVRVAKIWSERLGINMPAAITCVKPSGTVSQRVNSASGLHPRYSKHYIRRVRISSSDPLAKMLIDQGYPHNPENNQDPSSPKTWVFEFPIKSPKKSVTRDEMSALDQLEHWKIIQEHWCEHKPSITVYVKDNEWMEVGAWVYKNWGLVSGVSFLPYDGGIYRLAPYEEITEDRYSELVKQYPKSIDFSKLVEYEKEDYTTGSKELACIGGSCEL